MIDLAVGGVLLSLRMMLLIDSLNWLLGGTILSHVAWQSTLETCAKSLSSLRGGILLGLSCQKRNLWNILPRLLHNWMNYSLLGAEHEIFRTLHLKVGTLHRELRTLVLELRMQNLHWCMTREWGSDELTRLREAGLSVASRILAQKTHLALAIFLHLFQLILDDDGLVNQMLKIWVVGVEQLKLDPILEPLEKCVLLLLIAVDIVDGVP
jgi:hypothetical protein